MVIPSKYRCRGCKNHGGASKSEDGTWKVDCSGAGTAVPAPRKQHVPIFELCPHRGGSIQVASVRGCLTHSSTIMIPVEQLTCSALQKLAQFSLSRKKELLGLSDRGELDPALCVLGILSSEREGFEKMLREIPENIRNIAA